MREEIEYPSRKSGDVLIALNFKGKMKTPKGFKRLYKNYFKKK